MSKVAKFKIGDVVLFMNRKYVRTEGEIVSVVTMDFSQVVDQVPQLKRGRVWCRSCGRSQYSGLALSSGWPKCCGYTMTIDSPEEQAKFEVPSE